MASRTTTFPANPLQTPNAIVPEWYFLPFYAILRSVPDKLLGVIGDVRLHPGVVRAPLARHLAGAQRALPANVSLVPAGWWWCAWWALGLLSVRITLWSRMYRSGRLATIYYFLHFLVLVPLFGFIERPLPLPESISRPVLPRNFPGGGGGPLPSGAAAKPMEKI